MISVCVPYWDRQPALDRMFANLREIYGEESGLEIVVADDGSAPSAVVPPGVTLVRLPTKPGPLNPCVPINAAVAASSAEVIVITNPEVEHSEPTIDRMCELLDGPDDYVVARCWDVERRMWLADQSVDFTKNGRAPVPPGGQFHFCAMLYRSLWERAGGFDEDYRHVQGHDDNDWLFRLARVGARFRLSDSVVLHHRGTPIRWNLPSGRALLRSKWGV